MPYAIGLQSAVAAFLSAGLATHFTVAVITFLAIILITSAFQADGVDEPTSLPGIPLLHILPFFRRRFDFLNWAFHATGQTVFQFKLLRNTVIVVSGESARQAFFSAKGLDLTEGFKILSGAIPMVRGVTSDLQTRRVAQIHKRLTAVQREANLSMLIPRLLEDIRKITDGWGHIGTFDPFENVYELTFQTTVRSLSCDEIADDPKLVLHLKQLYDKLDSATTPASVLLPWLPTPSMISKLWATKSIYDIVVEAIGKREEALARLKDEDDKPDDALQMLLDNGDEKLVIVGFIMGLLIAGARATGTTASWLVTFLAGHPGWASKARMEVEEVLSNHCRSSLPSRSCSPLPSVSYYKPVCESHIGDTGYSCSTWNRHAESTFGLWQTSLRISDCCISDFDTNGPVENCRTCSSNLPFTSSSSSQRAISQSLSEIPLEVWEHATPCLDAIIKETTRVAQPHTAMRRNLGPDLYIDGKVIPNGAYVVYPFSDVHLDEDIYEDAWKFNPGRWMEGSEGEKETRKEATYEYVGWGGGKTVCLGTRLAKLEMKLILAMVVLTFDFGIVNKEGQPLRNLPVPNWNDILMCRPPKGSFYIKYSKKETASL